MERGNLKKTLSKKEYNHNKRGQIQIKGEGIKEREKIWASGYQASLALTACLVLSREGSRRLVGQQVTGSSRTEVSID